MDFDSDQFWNLVDKNGDGQIDVAELEKAFNILNINMSKQLRNTVIPKSAGVKQVPKEEVQKFLHLLENDEQLQVLYEKVKGDLKEFFETVQGDRTIVPGAESTETSSDFGSFQKYFFSESNQAYNHEKLSGYLYMNRPLIDYYINSSHNTYLSGDQLQSQSSLEAYEYALKCGCRCVELDVWDSDEGPIVYHGHTLTSKIFFRDVIDTVKQFAFVASPYPIILSLEVHCKTEGQREMASLLRNTLGDMLVSEELSETATPERLKNKILIKGKGQSKIAAIEKAPEEEEDDEFDEEAADPKAEVKASAPAKQSKHETPPELASLAIYMKSKKFKSFKDAFASFNSSNVSSFVETTALEMAKKHREEFIKFNNMAVSRIYPKGTRIDSSNYDPIPFWLSGCQLVALNFQTFDRHHQVNSGFFRQNGGSGYILKPNLSCNVKGNTMGKLLRVCVISGSRLPKPRNATKGEVVDPYVCCELIYPRGNSSGMMSLFSSEVVKTKRFETEAINDNGFNPVWTNLKDLRYPEEYPHKCIKKSFRFKQQIITPELSFLRLLVKDKDIEKDDFLATSVIPINCLKSGYRRVKLYDYKGQVLTGSYLFIYVNLQ